MKKRNVKKGFTLVELIVVIAIIGILAAVIVPRFTNYQQSARRVQVVTDAKQIATAIDAFQANSPSGAWPLEGTDNSLIKTNAGVNTTFTTALVLETDGGFTFSETINSKVYNASRADGNSAVSVTP